jgi:hypothetical protein
VVSLKAAKTLDSTDGKRRVLLVRRSDGYFGLVEQYWYQNIYEGKLVAEGWAFWPLAFFDLRDFRNRRALSKGALSVAKVSQGAQLAQNSRSPLPPSYLFPACVRLS